MFRLNFSHGTHDDHAKVHAAIRALETRDRPADRASCRTCRDPRSGSARSRTARSRSRPANSVRFVLGRETAARMRSRCRIPRSSRRSCPGDDLLIDDGRVRLEAGLGRRRGDRCRGHRRRHRSRNRKGVNLPDTVLDLSPLTAKDRADLAFGLELGVDWVALSFVQKPADLIEARGLIGDRAGAAWPRSRSRRRSSRSRTSSACPTPSWWRAAISASRSRTRTCPAGRRSWCSCCRLRRQAGDRRDPDAGLDGARRRRRPAPRPRTSRPPSMTAPTR